MSDTLEAGRDLDALIAEKVMGLAVVRDWDGSVCHLVRMFPDYENEYEIPPYSTDITAAWVVVDKTMADGWLWDLDTYAEDGTWKAVVERSEAEDLRIGSGRGTVALAICIAALAALECAA